MRRELTLFFFVIASSIKQGISGNYIQLMNNGPVTIDTPITFTVYNSYRTIVPLFEYRFKFKNFDGKYDQTIVSSSTTLNLPITFNSPEIQAGVFYWVEVDVWYCFLHLPILSIGTESEKFTLSDSLIGSIEYEQIIPKEKVKQNYVSTESQVNLTAKIKDPTGFFEKANLTYKWIVNGLPEEESYSQVIAANFTQPQKNNISVIVSANSISPSTGQPIQKSGSFDITLISRSPIHNLTADGRTNVQLFRDESLQLTIKIDGGSPPFVYCWQIKDIPDNLTTIQSTCTPTNESFFIITRYFDQRGKKNLIIDVHNDVSSFSKNITILIFEIEHQAQLSFILVPVCSIILAIFIIVAGIAIHMRQRKELSIEVADFDFQSYDEMIERTFFERIRDSFTQSLRSSIFRPCAQRTEYDNFVDKMDSDDILPGEPNISECNLRFSGDLNDSGVSGDIRS